MTNLASSYSNQGQLIEADELEVQVMKTRKRVLGQKHPDTLQYQYGQLGIDIQESRAMEGD